MRRRGERLSVLMTVLMTERDFQIWNDIQYSGGVQTVHGANSTLNKGATGLPLRASAVLGHRGGEREEREREEKGDRITFGEGEHTAL